MSNKIEEAVENWLAFGNGGLKLTISDKQDIETGKQLNDKHVNFAQFLLKSKFDQTEGLSCTLYQSKLNLDNTKPLVQILHSRGNHWIVISNIECGQGKMIVYDTIYSEIDDETIKLIYSITKATKISLVHNLQKQEGVNDCGVFAIAIATSLLSKTIPVSNRFTQSKLRSHLISCFINFNLTVFP